MKKKKYVIAIVVCLLASLLLAWKIKPVNLRNPSEKLIDLDATVKEPFGREGNPETDSTADTEEESTEEESDDSTKPANTSTVTKTTYEIKIRNTDINFNHQKYSVDTEEGISGLRNAILGKNSNSVEFILVDSYAEAHVYRKVCNLLDELRSSDHIAYSERMD